MYADFTKRYSVGNIETKESAQMIAWNCNDLITVFLLFSQEVHTSATQRIQPRAPVIMSPVGPGAQPFSLDKGESMPHPNAIPFSRSSRFSI